MLIDEHKALEQRIKKDVLQCSTALEGKSAFSLMQLMTGALSSKNPLIALGVSETFLSDVEEYLALGEPLRQQAGRQHDQPEHQ